MFVIEINIAAPTLDATDFQLVQVVNIGDVVLKSMSRKFGRDCRGEAADDKYRDEHPYSCEYLTVFTLRRFVAITDSCHRHPRPPESVDYAVNFF